MVGDSGYPSLGWIVIEVVGLENYVAIADDILGILATLSQDDLRLRFGGTVSKAAMRSSMRLRASKGNLLCFVAYVDNMAVGAIEMDISVPGCAELGLETRSGYCKRGITTSLMQTALDHAREHGIRVIRGESLTENSGARKLFTRSGFQYRMEGGYFFWEKRLDEPDEET